MKKRSTRNEYASVKRLKNKAMNKLALAILIPFFLLMFFGILSAGVQAYYHVQSVKAEHNIK